jgi:hypothetical protein
LIFTGLGAFVCALTHRTVQSHSTAPDNDSVTKTTSRAMISELRKVLKRLHYPLSFRHLEEMMQEREVLVDHSTVHRWSLKIPVPCSRQSR